jgi:hypothetical protein
LFDSASQGEQITVTTDRRIELETEWKPSIGRLIPGTPLFHRRERLPASAIER